MDRATEPQSPLELKLTSAARYLADVILIRGPKTLRKYRSDHNTIKVHYCHILLSLSLSLSLLSF
jgi:hypothetical protein